MSLACLSPSPGIRRAPRHGCLLLPQLLLGGCSPLQHGFLAPAGLAASGERDLLLWIVGLTLVVVLPVILLTPLIVWRYRHGNHRAAYRPRWEFSWLLWISSPGAYRRW